jgi:hypothetical protein
MPGGRHRHALSPVPSLKGVVLTAYVWWAGNASPPAPDVTGPAERGKKGACPMTVGLLSMIAAVLYGGTVSVLAFTATFARRPTLRREARSTLAVLLRGRAAE